MSLGDKVIKTSKVIVHCSIDPRSRALGRFSTECLYGVLTCHSGGLPIQNDRSTHHKASAQGKYPRHHNFSVHRDHSLQHKTSMHSDRGSRS